MTTSTPAAQTSPLISPIRSALVRVTDLDRALDFYENGLGLRRVGVVDEIDGALQRFWGLEGGTVRAARVGHAGGGYGLVDLIAWSEGGDAPFRATGSPWNHGPYSLSVYTTDLDRALLQLEAHGATTVSTPTTYHINGDERRGVVVQAPDGTRLMVVQNGPTVAGEPLWEDYVTSCEMIVPSLAEARRLLEEVFCLACTAAVDRTGAPFDGLLGVPSGTRVEAAILSGGGHDHGLFEPIQLHLPDGRVPAANEASYRDAHHTGLWMLSTRTADFHQVEDRARQHGILAREPMNVRYPFETDRRRPAILIELPGGILVECTQA